MSVKLLEMKFDGTRYKDKTGIVWELDGTKHDFGAYIGDYYAVRLIHYTHKQLIDMEFEEVIDWRKLPIDTKILVWSRISKQKYNRHFAGIDDETGQVKAWNTGQTSFTTTKSSTWENAELYKEEV